MNEDVIRRDSERSFLTSSISRWWLLVPGIMMALIIFGLITRTQPNGKRTDSKVLGKAISDAVTQFSWDYKHLPTPPSYKDGQDSDTDSSGAEGFIKILSGRESDSGPRQNRDKINYLEGMKAAKARTGVRSTDAKGSDKWISGLVMEENNFEMVDGWGNYYRIRLDSNNDGEILNPNTDEAADGRTKLSNRVIVWSPGKDGKWETWSDNVKLWD